MKGEWGPKRRELLARTIADMGKAVFAVGLASRFFGDMILPTRLLMVFSMIALVGIALWFQPKEKDHV